MLCHPNGNEIEMNNKVKITQTEILSQQRFSHQSISFEIESKDGSKENQVREIFERGNGAAILLYNSESKTVVLTRQFRLPTYLNGNDSGYLIEACAGMLDDDNPEDCIRRETEEETGYKIEKVQKIFEAYMSPGALTEILHFYIAEYSNTMKVGDGGGLAHEQEDIEVLEMRFEIALEMIASGEIKDAKTILLLQHLKCLNLF